MKSERKDEELEMFQMMIIQTMQTILEVVGALCIIHWIGVMDWTDL